MVVTPVPSVSGTRRFSGCQRGFVSNKPGLTRRRLVSTLKQSPESRRYGCDPDLCGDRAGQQQQDHIRSTADEPKRDVCAAGWQRDTTRRTSWPRASGPSSRITGAEPACMVSACGCALVPDARSFPAGAVRAVARSLPDRTSGLRAVLSARNRMTRSIDFDATVRHGIRMAQRDVVVHFRRGSGHEAAAPRVGLVVGKSVGSAVERHRVARRLRHVARTMLGELAESDQLVIRALPSSRTASSARLEQELRRCLRRLPAPGSQP